MQLLCYASNISNIKDKQSVGAPGHKAPGLKQLGKNPITARGIQSVALPATTLGLSDKARS